MVYILTLIRIGLFRNTNTDEVAYTINEQSSKVEDDYCYYEFFGLVLAKAIFDEIPLNLCLCPLLFKLILNPDAMITLDDIKEYDTSTYLSLKYILDNDIDEDEYLELYFQHEFNGEMYSLVNDGEAVRVRNENKESYVLLKIDFMVKNFIYEQVEAIRKGMFKLLPQDILKDFTETEFEYLACGEHEIDIDDWKAHTVYSGVYTAEHNVIQWFWKTLSELDQKSLSIIFQFVTGMSRLPAGGFNHLNKNRGEKQSFNIRSISYFKSVSYPQSYTCFNRLHLPLYTTEEELREGLQYIIDHNEVYGFGLE